MNKITLFQPLSTKPTTSLVNKFTTVTVEDQTDSYLRTMDSYLDTTNTILSALEFGLIQVSKKNWTKDY